MKKMFPECVMIFILPPSIAELSRRLHKRGTETEEVIALRLETAKKELEFAKNYDYFVVNDALEDAVSDFLTVVRAEKLKAANNPGIIGKILG